MEERGGGLGERKSGGGALGAGETRKRKRNVSKEVPKGVQLLGEAG